MNMNIHKVHISYINTFNILLINCFPGGITYYLNVSMEDKSNNSYFGIHLSVPKNTSIVY